MAILLDETTRAEYLAQSVASTRAALVVSALSGTVVVEVFDGTDTLRASGTMAAPWAVASGETITVGEVNATGLVVASGGAPTADWYCQFRSGTRFVRGTFGLAGSGRDFVWSLASFDTGSKGTIGTATLTASGTSAVNLAPVWTTVPTLDIVQGSAVSVAGYVSDPEGAPLTYTLGGTLPSGVTFDAATAQFTASAGAPVGLSGLLTVTADDGYVDSTSAPSVVTAPTILGTAQQGQTLTATTGSWTGSPTPTYAYQWRRSGVDVAGATASAYILGASDVGATISVRVTATNTAGSASADSLSTATVTAAPTGGTVTTLRLVATTTGTHPWTCAQPLRQGDVPSGSVLTASGETMHCHIESRWPDGSARVAILTGSSAFTANSPRSLTLVSGAAPGGTPLSRTAFFSTYNPAASVSYGAYGTVSLSGATFVRERYAGPNAAEWHFRADFPSDSHLQAWFYVTAWSSGRYRVAVRVENGRDWNTSPGTKTGAATVTIAGSQRFSGSVSMKLFEAWDSIAYDGTQPVVRPRHDMVYFRSTKLIPNIRLVSPSTTMLNGLTTTYSPMSIPNLTASMGSGGYDQTIGLTTRVDAAYIASDGDSRAYDAMFASGRGASSYPISRRESSTGRPARLSAMGNIVSPDGYANYEGTYQMKSTHMPALGYVPYLVTGEWQFMETCQSCANAVWYMGNLGSLSGGTGGTYRRMYNEVRGIAWTLRQAVMSAAINPTGDAVGTQHGTWLSQNVTIGWYPYYSGINHATGIFEGYNGDAESGSPAGIQLQPWMQDFCAMAFGIASDLEVLTGTPQTQLVWMRDYTYRVPVGRLGASDGTAFDYRQAAQYVCTFGPTEIPGEFGYPLSAYYATWKLIFDATVAAGYAVNPASLSGTALRGAYIDQPSSVIEAYWANIQPAIAYATTHGATGASAAWSRLTTASNWAANQSSFAEVPQWFHEPR